jgi:hypothetical protein
MKRTTAGGKSSKKQATSMLKWVKEVQNQDDNIIVNVCEQNMHMWDIVFKPEILKAEKQEYECLKFEFEGDVGYQACTPDATEVYDRLYRDKSKGMIGHSCFPLGNTYYRAEIDSDGNITQENLQTGTKRSVRPILHDALHDDIIKWFAKHGNGKIPGVHLKVYFYDSFPNSPPFVRVVAPRFMQWTGHITIGGSMCTELLTSTGWNTNMSAMGFLLQLKSNIMEGNAKVDMSTKHEYTEMEALEAFNRVARDHGWKVPSTHTYLPRSV